mmetsp:Transcript_31545/g.50995  ORF Transcript_31545/g.50995 Transcript_31545/m.50995 type:complete len:638 (-) Transcript_31545:709-2622(-)
MTHLAHKDGVAAAAAEALHALCLAHAPNVRRALRLGMVPALTAAMVSNVRCPHVTAAAATLLQGLAARGQGIGLPSGAADAVTAEVRLCLANTRIAALDEAEGVARLGLVAVVLAALRLHRSSRVEEGIMLPLLHVVRRWAWDHALRAVLGEDGACQLLFQILRDHGLKQEHIAETTLGALHALAWNPDNKLRLADVQPHEGMGLVVRALEAFPHLANVQIEGMGVISIMSYYSDGNKALLHRCGAIPSLVSAMEKHRDAGRVQEQACLAIWSLATQSLLECPTQLGPQIDAAPLTPKGKPSRAKAGARQLEMPSPQKPSRDMVQAEERRGALCMYGAVEALLAALHEHETNGRLCCSAARALVVLSYNHKGRSRRIYSGLSLATTTGTRRVGGLQIFREALQIHVKHADVLCQVAAAIKNVCSALMMDDVDQTHDMPDLVPCGLSLLEALRLHLSNAELLKQGLSALGNVALNMKANAALPLAIVDLLLDAMAQHRHDGDLQKRGMAALFNLAGYTKGAPRPGPAARVLNDPQRKDIYATRMFSQLVHIVMELHGDNGDLVVLALKLLGRLADAATATAAAKILAPPVTTRFSLRLTRNRSRQAQLPGSSEWGKAHERIVEQWNALIKKRIVKDSK